LAIKNRGKHSNDDKNFASKWHPIFKDAVDDLCFLLSRGYAYNSALQIVGNRYKLNKRQQAAILRISASDQAIKTIFNRKCEIGELKDKVIELDGFNILILLESAISGGYIFKGRDDTFRDLSSVHGTYKRVIQTKDAIQLIGDTLKKLKVKHVKWYLDQPVSNSGRLKTMLLEISAENEFDWEVELVYSPDKVLAESKNIVVSSDAWILGQAEKWFNLGSYLIENHISNANVIFI